MAVSLASQFTLFLYSILCGGLLGGVWDGLRLLRMLGGLLPIRVGKIPLPRALPLLGRVPLEAGRGPRLAALLTALADIFFFLAAALVCRIFLFLFAEGAFRFFVLAGWILGFAFYRFTLGRLVLLAYGPLVFLWRAAWGYLRFFLLFPLGLAGKGLAGLALALYRQLSARRYLRRMQKRSLRGFFRKEPL